jgi:hypothetical protein
MRQGRNTINKNAEAAMEKCMLVLTFIKAFFALTTHIIYY